MSHWFKIWPLLGLPLMWLCNIDLYVIPLLRLNLSFTWTVIISCLLATIELIYLYWTIGWVIKNLKNKTLSTIKSELEKEAEDMHEGTALAKEIIVEVKNKIREEGYTTRIKGLAKKHLDPEKFKESDIFKFIHWGGPLTLFFIAIIPEPGLRLLGTFFCRLANWRGAFIALLAGNIVKTIAMVQFWEYLNRISIELRFLIIALTLVFFWLLVKVAKHHIKKLT